MIDWRSIRRKYEMKWLKENFVLALVILGILALTIVTNLPYIMDFGDGSFVKGIILFPVAIIGGIVIFNAFRKLFDDVDTAWQSIIIFLVIGLCLIGFIEIVKGL
jgi:hypothetical protein